MSRRLPIVIVALLAAHCSSQEVELPEVRRAPTLALDCAPSAYGVEAVEVVEATRPDLFPCVKLAWTKGCDGQITFQLAVDEWGEITALRFEGDSSSDLQQCIAKQLKGVVLLPAVDCRGTRLAGKIGGGISWSTNSGTGVAFGHEAGYIAAIGCWSGPTMD